MERAVFITRAEQLRFARPPYTRLYFGNEFCQRLLPSVAELRRALCVSARRKMDFTLVTPYLTDSGIPRLKSLLAALAHTAPAAEVVVNDWGALQIIARDFPGLKPVLGRLLTKQKRGPTIPRLLSYKHPICWAPDPSHPGSVRMFAEKNLPDQAHAYYKGANTASVPILQRFLLSLGVSRIELDNTPQGVEMDLPPGMRASLYTPYGYITTTFYCPTAACSSRKDDYRKIRPCRRQCRRLTFTLRHKSMPSTIFLKGNTHFYRNRLSVARFKGERGVDRVVYEPELP